ncbi:MAG: Gfo/Idh/MocA family oxidoreductase, partial [Anaerolineae bacterium]|nr:Gfo/Idh/MocA family oxidoreductase [Anaerolineae bacterium]
MAYRGILIGTGGFGRLWCQTFLPPNMREGLIDIVAAVDVDTAALTNAQTGLGLRADQCYTDLGRALAESRADFCIVVVPPADHEAVIKQALAHDLHILSEKPIADTLEASVRIAQVVKDAGKKMGVTMSHRFDQDKQTLRREINSGQHGDLDYLVCRFTYDARRFGTAGKVRHGVPDALIIEGAVHHLDILEDMAGALCTSLYAQTWTPPWGEYAGASQALVNLQFANGVRATYEMTNSSATTLNGWTNEYVRAECEKAVLVLDRRRLEIFRYNPEARSSTPPSETLPLLNQPKWANTWLIEQFVRWLDGGEPMATHVEANLQS